MLDCLHVNEEQLVKGGPTYNSIVVAIDVCSRYAVVAPLTNLTSDTLKEFLVNRVYGPFGHPAELLTDGGPEFRKHFEQACLDLQVAKHRSIAYHARGHGKVERFHSTFLQALAKTVPQEDRKSAKPWVKAIPFTTLGYNSAVHSALSNGRVGISPGEVFFGRRLTVMPLSKLEGLEAIKGDSLNTVQVKQNVLDALQWVSECQEKYDKKMDEQVLRRSGIQDREFTIGDLVTVQHKLGPRKVSKLSRNKDGPYKVTALPDAENVTTYTLQLVGGAGKSVKGHPSSMVPYYDVHEDEIAEDSDYTDTEVDADSEHEDETDYKIEEIIGEKGNVKKGTKQFLCKYLGYDEPEWTALDAMYGCDKLIRTWNRKDERAPLQAKRSTRLTANLGSCQLTSPKSAPVACKLCGIECTSRNTLHHHLRHTHGYADAPKSLVPMASASHVAPTPYVPIWKNVITIDTHTGIEDLLTSQGYLLSQLAHIHASPPCQTFAAPDPTNSTKNPPCHFRDPKDPERAPRQGGEGCPYRRKAILHDGLVKHILALLTGTRELHSNFQFTIENPRAALRRRPYMTVSNWPSAIGLAIRQTVDYCAYGFSYRKSTDIWTSLLEWIPRGNTGSGRCQRECEQGSWYADGRGGFTFRHHINLAQDPKDGIRGPGARQQLNALPKHLLHEFLSTSLLQWRERGGGADGLPPVLVDLCSGYGSLSEVATELGFQYIGVDVKPPGRKTL